MDFVMWLKWLFVILVLILAMMLAVTMWSPQRRRAVHQTFVLLAKIVLAMAICGAAIAYFKRY